MTTIKLERITGQGFLSFYDPFEFPISNYEGKTLQIDSHNENDQMSKSNGGGKSSLLETISWGLYGELCRKNRYKDDVIFNRNGVKAKEATVILILEIQGEFYRIEREIGWKRSPELSIKLKSSPPYGELLDGATSQVKQEFLEQLLGVNFTAFQCCVMNGRDFMSFPDLKPADRARVLTEVRGLEKYVTAAKNASDKVKTLRETVGTETQKLNTLEGRITQLRETDYKTQIQEFEARRKEEIENLKAEAEETQDQIKELEKKQKEEIKSLKERLSQDEKTKKAYQDKLKELPTLEEKRKEVNEQLFTLTTENEVFHRELQKKRQEIEEFKRLKTGKCSRCHQPITGEHLKLEIVAMQNGIKDFEKEAEKLNLKSKIQETLKQLKEVEDKIQNLRKYEGKIREVQEFIHKAKNTLLRAENPPEALTLQTTLTDLKNRATALKDTKNPHEKQEKERKELLFDLVRQGKGLKQVIEDQNLQIQFNQFWVEGFKKIRMDLFSTMIDRFQDYTQTLLSQYSSELQIAYSTQRETRSNTIKDEFNISITDNSGEEHGYEMYSGGEKQKVRLAISQALANMIKDDCGRDFNFMAFDEPNDALDDVGKDINFGLFTQLAEAGKAVLVTDHDSIFKDKFDDSILVIKEGDKSRIQLEMEK